MKIFHTRSFGVATIILFLNYFPINLPATNYYVSNAGMNSNTGLASDEAFETLQKAADVVTVGDTVFVIGGTYAGFDIRNVNGAPNQLIVFIASNKDAVINSKGPLREDGINIENADYIEVNGFQVSGMINGGNGIRVVTSDYCIVRNCYCDQNDERGIFTGFTDDILIEYNTCTNSVDEHGIYVSNSSDRPIVRYNECFGNNNIGIHMNGDLSAGGDGIISDAQIYGNSLHDNNLASGINMDGCENPLVYNNLIYNNHNAQGIALFQGDGAIPTQGAKIFNNTIIIPSDGRWGILVTSGSNVDTKIYNNIIINEHAWRGCITVEDTTQFTSDFNILQDKMSNTGDGSTISLAAWQSLGLDIHSILADPLSAIFVDSAGNDYHLSPTSQAINTGTSVVSMEVGIDLNGDIRPQGNEYDIGCYEFNEATTNVDVFLQSDAITLYPNPTVNFFKIRGMVGIYTIDILNSDGSLYQNLMTSTDTIEVDLSTVPAGLYFIRIQQIGTAELSLEKILKIN